MRKDNGQRNIALPILILLLCTGVVVRLVIGLQMNLMREDALITLRFARNILRHGQFAFNLDERVLGASSPLWTLATIPLVALDFPHFSILFLFLGTFFTITAVAFLLVACRDCAVPPQELVIAALFLVFDWIFIEISGGGMETPLFLLLIALSIFWLARERLALSAICVGLGILTRPEGIILAIAWGITVTWNFGLPAAFRGLGIALLFTLPWLVFATIYFGSPVPQSVFAKSALSTDALTLGEILWRPDLFWFVWQRFSGSFWESQPLVNLAVRVALNLLFALGALHFVLEKRQRVLSIMPLFCIGIVLFFYLGRGQLYPWYAPPALLCYWMTTAVGIGVALRALPVPRRWRDPAFKTVYLVIVLLLVVVGHKRYVEQIATVQAEQYLFIPTGQYLSEHVAPQERVMLEPLGYIGYFSDARVIDLAGLVSPEITSIKRAAGGAWPMTAIRALHPDVIVLRSYEVPANHFFINDIPMFRDAQERAEFNAAYKIEKVINWDRYGFTIYRRAQEPVE